LNLRRPVLKRVLTAAFVALALAFFAVALIDAWHATGGELPSVPRLVLAGLLQAVGLFAAAYAWATLLGGSRVDHGASLFVANLGKYIPGAVWQATGQITLARSAGVRVQRGITAFTVLAMTQVVAAGVYGLLLAATWTSAALAVRVLLVVGSLAVLMLLDRRWLVWALHKIPRTRDASSEIVPSQRAIFGAWAAGIVTLGAASAAYLVVLGSLTHVGNALFVAAAYACAWTVGFVVVPIPSGVGIRETVLAGILHGAFPTSILVAASVYQRLVTIVVEGLLAAIAAHRVRSTRVRARVEAADEEA
jgi:glycosyltransferase 2 family protein